MADTKINKHHSIVACISPATKLNRIIISLMCVIDLLGIGICVLLLNDTTYFLIYQITSVALNIQGIFGIAVLP